MENNLCMGFVNKAGHVYRYASLRDSRRVKVIDQSKEEIWKWIMKKGIL